MEDLQRTNAKLKLVVLAVTTCLLFATAALWWDSAARPLPVWNQNEQ